MRPIVLSNPILPNGERTISRFLNPDVFARPAIGDRGNAPKDVIRGPGINNWDLTFMKEFRVKERLRFTFRSEMYNALNHTQFLSIDNAARFDAAGKQTNQRLGALIANRDPRRSGGAAGKTCHLSDALCSAGLIPCDSRYCFWHSPRRSANRRRSKLHVWRW